MFIRSRSFSNQATRGPDLTRSLESFSLSKSFLPPLPVASFKMPSKSDEISYVFRWPYGGTEVAVGGEFNDWTLSKMKKEGEEFVLRVDHLQPRKRYLYKYHVDGEWIQDLTAPVDENQKVGGIPVINNLLVTGSSSKDERIVEVEKERDELFRKLKTLEKKSKESSNSNEKVEVLEGEKSNLIKLNRLLMDSKKESEEKMKKLKEENESQEEEIQRLKNETKASKESEQLKTQLESSQKNLEKIQNEYKNLEISFKKEKESLEKEIQNVKEELKKNSENSGEVKKNQNTLQKDLEKSQQENQKLEALLDKEKEKVEKLQLQSKQENDSHLSQRRELEKELENLREYKTEAKKNLESQRIQLEEANKNLKEAEERNRNPQEERVEVRRERSQSKKGRKEEFGVETFFNLFWVNFCFFILFPWWLLRQSTSIVRSYSRKVSEFVRNGSNFIWNLWAWLVGLAIKLRNQFVHSNYGKILISRTSSKKLN